jgi:hypothetical protein
MAGTFFGWQDAPLKVSDIIEVCLFVWYNVDGLAIINCMCAQVQILAGRGGWLDFKFATVPVLAEAEMVCVECVLSIAKSNQTLPFSMPSDLDVHLLLVMLSIGLAAQM